jgi:hypothetical protein
MMRLRRASVIAALSLLAWAATASAERGWVLWRVSVEDWLVVRAFSTEDGGKTTCDRVAASYTTASLRGPGRSWGFTCLPDTVDPRGPKGK